jgi:apolipoprotein N-acyltransferase
MALTGTTLVDFIWSKNWFWRGFALGSIYFSYIFFWLWGLYPLKNFNVNDSFAAAVIIIILFLLCVAQSALFWGLAFHFSAKLYKKGRLLSLAVPASVFIVAEFFRSIFFGLFWAGNGSVVGPDWTFGNIAYLFSDISWIRASSALWGIYGISFFIILIATILFEYTLHKSTKYLYASAGIFISFIGLGGLEAQLGESAALKSDQETLSVAVVQSDLITTDNQQEIINHTANIGDLLDGFDYVQHPGSLVILPESSRYTETYARILGSPLLFTIPKINGLPSYTVIDNSRITNKETSEPKSRTLMYDNDDYSPQYKEKVLLTPAGEYIPDILYPLFVYFSDSVTQDVADKNQYSPGTDGVIDFRSKTADILICSEIISPRMAKGEYGFIVAQVNFGLFHKNFAGDILRSQIQAMSQFRAAENRKFLALAANRGNSYIVNPAGNVVQKAENEGYKLLTSLMVTNDERTWYNKVGDWPIFVLAAMMILLCFRFNFKQR